MSQQYKARNEADSGGMRPSGPPGSPGRGPMGHGPMGAMMPGERAKSFKKTMQTFLTYLKPYRISLVIVLVFAIASTVFSIIGPKLLGNATTRLFEGVVSKAMNVSGTAIDFTYIGRIALILLVLYLLSMAFNYIQGYIMSGIAMKVTYEMRKNVSQKIKRLPLRYLDQKTHGEVQSHITNDIDTINATLTQNLTQIVTSATTIIGTLVMMLSISWLMTVVVLLILPLSILIVSRIVKSSQKYYKKQQAYLGHVNGHVEEMYGGHIVMKVFNGEEKSIKQFDSLNNELYGAVWRSQFLTGMMMPIMGFVGNLAYVAVAVLGAYLTVQRTIGVGDILAFIQYVRSFNMPLTQMANIANMLQSTAAAAERVFEFLGEKEEIPEAADAVKLGKVKGDVSFCNVRFGYTQDAAVIHDFSVEVHAGQKVAIVGPTGAGKTTIVKLLMRFYDIDNGSIIVDGVDIRRLIRSELRSMFGMVLQDTWLFNGTIKENIRYGNLEASDEQVINAARMAYVDHFVRTLPQGYDMELNEETSNISQGQKQLLTIARAFLANPSILILDEATSSVDTRTEVFIQRAMGELMKDRTSFVIAHRLSTIRDADVILVLNNGDIVEQGNHKALLSANGFYASLYRSQFQTAAEGDSLILANLPQADIDQSNRLREN